jgi:hypothetical protein
MVDDFLKSNWVKKLISKQMKYLVLPVFFFIIKYNFNQILLFVLNFIVWMKILMKLFDFIKLLYLNLILMISFVWEYFLKIIQKYFDQISYDPSALIESYFEGSEAKSHLISFESAFGLLISISNNRWIQKRFDIHFLL